MTNNKAQTRIYVPTEAGLPILEAGERPNGGEPCPALIVDILQCSLALLNDRFHWGRKLEAVNLDGS